MELKTKLICPQCGVELKDWTKFLYHVNHFNHQRNVKRDKRNERLVAAYQSGHYLSVSSMARHFRLSPYLVWQVLKRKGVLRNVRGTKGTKPAGGEPANNEAVLPVQVQPVFKTGDVGVRGPGLPDVE